MTKPPRPFRPALERLEDRTTPSTSGVTWPDGRHLTLSFVPDGTRVGGAASGLYGTLDAVAPTATWQREILRAFQAWASQTNVNVGVVEDGGQPLGTGGAVQGDERFGDIRIAAVPLPANTLITNTAFQWSGTTWSGDILINSANAFSVGGAGNTYDLFTAMLNEAGNVFGVVDSTTDPASAVYHEYLGPKTGLSAADVADVRALYGARSADAFDAAGGNGTLATADTLSGFLGLSSTEADITSAADVDFYRFSAPLFLPGVLNLVVGVNTAGLSGLRGSLKVYNSLGLQIGSATADGPGDDLSVTINQLSLGGTYYVRVAGTGGDAFAVGGYKLNVGYRLFDGTLVQAVTNITGLLSHELGLNDLLGTATSLLPTGTASDARFEYTTRGTILTGSDADYYRLTAPATAGQKMNVLVWATELNALVPEAEVFDALGRPVAAQLLGNEDGTFGVEVASATPGATYYVKVSALNPGGLRVLGNYFLGVSFTAQPGTELETLAGGTLGQSTAVHGQTLAVGQNQLYHFVLSANASAAWAQVKMEVLNADGLVVFTLSAYSGQPSASGHVYLQAGNYTVRYRAAARTGTAFVPVAYTLRGRIASDPIGPRQNGGGSTTQTTWGNTPPQTASSTSKWDRPSYF